MCSGSHVKVYSYSSREVVFLLSHHTQNVTALALNPRNRMQVHGEMKNGSPDKMFLNAATRWIYLQIATRQLSDWF